MQRASRSAAWKRDAEKWCFVTPGGARSAFWFSGSSGGAVSAPGRDGAEGTLSPAACGTCGVVRSAATSQHGSVAPERPSFGSSVWGALGEQPIGDHASRVQTAMDLAAENLVLSAQCPRLSLWFLLGKNLR